jgi:cytochrome c oxidase subunit 4
VTLAVHVVDSKVYYRVFAALVGLLVLTVAATAIEGALLSLVVAMTIAVSKALLIMLYFMHLRYSRPLTQIFAVAGFCWLAILLIIGSADYLTR